MKKRWTNGRGGHGGNGDFTAWVQLAIGRMDALLEAHDARMAKLEAGQVESRRHTAQLVALTDRLISLAHDAHVRLKRLEGK